MSRARRLVRITWVICRFRLDDFLHQVRLPLPVRLLLLFAPWHLFPRNKVSRGERLRLALEQLGPVFVKFGQILSTRRDLLPEDMADALRDLQDRVPPFPGEQAQQIVEHDLGKPVGELFRAFDASPLASASVAQVHAAELLTGQEVVVKVIRPGIEKVIHQDIALMYLLARLLQRHWPDGRRLRPVEVVADYEQTIFDELDLQREAANASQLRRNFPDSTLIYIPEVFWNFVSRRVLVMERIYGIPVADMAALQEAGADLRILAEKGVETFFTQVFRDSFFHADMHPGNIFIDASNPRDPRYIAIDFGIVGTLTPADQTYLARNLLAFFNRDYRQVAELHVQSGWVPATTRVNEFEAAIRTVCEPIFERPLKEISFGQFLLRLFQVARRFNMEVQPQLVLLQKTLLNVEGLGRQLYPDLDLWRTAHPFLEDWMYQRLAPPGLIKTMREQLPDWLEQTPEMPQLLHDALKQLTRLESTNRSEEKVLTSLRDEVSIAASRHRRYWLATLCVGGAVVVSDMSTLEWFRQLPPSSWILVAAAAYLLWPRRNETEIKAEHDR
ncbi:ubiquinone biosynthesis regulatory protein kinase UbiB [Hydrocarboniclastica marina]|uniref:Probable protein kinase UbiB n=1 Tax=Hydrocarboniclastica marina TaxID=2259620 RepID=A0A4P7XIW9_9ALTE|nr:ubiquinone biosynthesis regulatory protein kinase UbiB [Hydrocarboniclastica marina]QCF26958.1 ubiquinone biosynthesis regulatory protein kinase UbiB [Hydrocarboniclastica marina]